MRRRIVSNREIGAGVYFNVDDSGFLKQTGWLGGEEGFLVLDRNLNDTIDAGSELFSNANLADSLKGVSSLCYWDANYDGTIELNLPRRSNNTSDEWRMAA